MMFGMNLVISHDLPVVWDYSGCRSPSRAERRFKRNGHINPHMVREPDKAVVMGNTAFVSPRMYHALQRQAQ